MWKVRAGLRRAGRERGGTWQVQGLPPMLGSGGWRNHGVQRGRKEAPPHPQSWAPCGASPAAQGRSCGGQEREERGERQASRHGLAGLPSRHRRGTWHRSATRHSIEPCFFCATACTAGRGAPVAGIALPVVPKLLQPVLGPQAVPRLELLRRVVVLLVLHRGRTGGRRGVRRAGAGAGAGARAGLVEGSAAGRGRSQHRLG